MLTIYLQGLFLGAAMILPLGPQNAFILQQGSRRQFHLMSAALCSLSDMILIAVGVFGGSALLNQSDLLMTFITWGGVVFLAWYGFCAARAALSNNFTVVRAEIAPTSRQRVIFILLAVTWLNPHVYLDTLIILGSIGGQLEYTQRSWFTFGALTASLVWFFGLSMLAAGLSPLLSRPISQRIINIFVASVMWLIAFKLAIQGIQH